MASNGKVTARFAKDAGTDARVLKRSGNVYVSYDGTTIYSYGSHFPMAVIMPSGDEPRGWWLVNGDRYSVTTSGHQSALRTALTGTGLPVLIVPFSALDRAGIKKASIAPVAIDPDEWTRRTVRGPAEDAPHGGVTISARHDDGTAEWEVHEHHLGGSVFTAGYQAYDRARGEFGEYVSGHGATFLSAFDEQEGHGLYFLAELPAGVHPSTVAEAFTALRPAEVQAADAAGVAVTRQGDVFAVPSDVTTRELGGQSERGAYVLEVNHTATEVRELDGATYARGTLRHRPRESWRAPEHRMQRMGDGKTWHRLYKNTVPDGRSWSVSGDVD